jgi:hypothetical protein
MFESLNWLGLPVKYAVIGFIGGLIWLLIAALIGYDSAISGPVTLLALTFGGFIGGVIRRWAGKTR